MMVGDYVLSFDEQTCQLREPLALSNVFRQMATTLPQPFDNSLRNPCSNQNVRSFVAERQHTDLLFLRLPVPIIKSEPHRDALLAWREEWLQGGDHFWDEYGNRRRDCSGRRCKASSNTLALSKTCCKGPRTFLPGP